MAEDLTSGLIVLFPGAVERLPAGAGEEAVAVAAPSLAAVMSVLRSAPFDFAMLLDLTCVDERPLGRGFTMVYHLLSLGRRRRLRVKTALPAAEPAVASLTGLWRNADWLEREVYDMFGIVFEGHPDLRRILMSDDFEGHPLRKDYPWRRRQPTAVEREGDG
jgi:NADH-quinone oxidoreductase subunit C